MSPKRGDRRAIPIRPRPAATSVQCTLISVQCEACTGDLFAGCCCYGEVSVSFSTSSLANELSLSSSSTARVTPARVTPAKASGAVASPSCKLQGCEASASDERCNSVSRAILRLSFASMNLGALASRGGVQLYMEPPMDLQTQALRKRRTSRLVGVRGEGDWHRESRRIQRI